MKKSFIIFCFIVFINYVNCNSSDDNIWWGPHDLKGTTNNSITPFQIEFSDKMIQDLKYRLENTRLPRPTFPGVGFQYGFNSREIPKWINYWAHDYQFKERERFLNSFPQYKTFIQGLSMHFIWIRPKVPPGVEIIPLLLLHGWPGSVREFYEVIPILTAVCGARDFAVEVVVPSLPGFGYSDPAVRPGLSPENMTTIFKNLMQRLGHEQFYVHAGDWGAAVASDMATKYPGVVLGLHTNLAMALTPAALMLTLLGEAYPSMVVKPEYADRIYPLTKTFLEPFLKEFGYFHLLASKTDTVGVSLSDSPAGLLAFIFQAMSSGTNLTYTHLDDGGLSHYNPETLIDNIMFYWDTNCITSASRIYYEALHQLSTKVLSSPTFTPTWAIQARYEIMYQSPLILKTKFRNLLHTTVLKDGGHFLALEKPRVLAEDVLKALQTFRKWHRLNKK